MVLVVDDDPSIRALFEFALTDAGLDVCTAADGAEARAALAAQPVSLVMLDCQLPDCDGLDLLVELRALPEWSTLPIILVTGQSDIETRVRGFERGATDYVVKPPDLDELVARVHGHLRARSTWLEVVAQSLQPERTVVEPLVHPRVPHTAQQLSQSEITDLIAQRRFRAVFQPVVDLERGAVVGYEALTRFAGDLAPDAVFERAWQFGLGLPLERATLDHILSAATGLPRQPWLSVNVSVRFLMAGLDLGWLRRDSRRLLVLELTEHDRVDDYGALARVFAELPPEVIRLAVDDTGSGYATLGHILMLHPTFVKLDATWVRGVDTDPTRQALVASLATFAQRVGCTLIAEGLETADEVAAVRACGVPLGQGFHLGRPAPVPMVVTARA
jgi:EAL domain-containing protein (putative c-di-GMP-specific phosphodiesterase class I)/CheY-like chemotaxis protein